MKARDYTADPHLIVLLNVQRTEGQWGDLMDYEQAMIERAIGTLYALTGASDRIGGNVWTSPPPFRTVNDYALLPEAQRRKALVLCLGLGRGLYLRQRLLHEEPSIMDAVHIDHIHLLSQIDFAGQA